MRIVELNREPIDLYKTLKFEGFVASGAQAKKAVACGHVSVNGAVETRQPKKIISGDIIEYGDVKSSSAADRNKPVLTGSCQCQNITCQIEANICTQSTQPRLSLPPGSTQHPTQPETIIEIYAAVRIQRRRSGHNKPA